ncbi:hypothetical protein SprV_0100128900 [Sparganum proliferum]
MPECVCSHLFQATPVETDSDCLQIIRPQSTATPDDRISAPILKGRLLKDITISSQEDVSRSARPIGWRGSRTYQKSQPGFDEPPTPCFAKHKRVRFVEKPEAQQYSCRSSPLEERKGLSNSKWPGNQDSRRWENPQFTLSLLDSPIHSKAYTTCLPYVCFKRKPIAKEKAIWRCRKNLQEKIPTSGRGATIRNSNFTKVLSGLVEHLRSERSLVLRLKGNSGHLGTRAVVQDESESKRDFPKREVKATNNYDLNLVFALAHNQMDSVYTTDCQPDEGFVDSPELLDGYIYPDSLVMGEWEGYEKPSQFWTDSDDGESNLYEPQFKDRARQSGHNNPSGKTTLTLLPSISSSPPTDLPLTVTDTLDGTPATILIDTGAIRSVLRSPHIPITHSPPSDIQLVTADGLPLRCTGTQQVSIALPNCTAVHPMLVSPDIRVDAIVGVDFRAHQLIIDPNNPARVFIYAGHCGRIGRTELVQHEINTGTTAPQWQPARRIPIHYQMEINGIISDLLAQGIIDPSNSPWAAPVTLVKKKDGQLRLCIDYRQLNKVIVRGSLPITRIDDTIAALAGASWFAILDLSDSYWQIEVRPEDRHKTAFILPTWLMGIANATATCQRSRPISVDIGPRRLLPWAFLLAAVLTAILGADTLAAFDLLVDCRFQQFGVTLHPAKSVLGATSLEFLGHQIDSNGIRDFPPSNSKCQLQRCLAALTSYERLKSLLADATLLTHFYADAPISLMADASNVAVGAVLQQRLPDCTVPLAFFTRKQSKAETRYSTFGRELLAAYLAVRQFWHLLEGREFTIFTHQIHHLDYASQLTSDIRHIDGSRNEVADALSRPSITHLQLSPGIDLAEMAAEQRRVGSPCDEDVSGLQLQDLQLTTGNGTILCDVPTPFHRPFMPPSLCRKVFSPPAQSISSWESSYRQAGFRPLRLAWDAQRPQSMDTGLYPLSTEFGHVHLDIVGPLPLSNGCSYLLTCVDRLTRWPEAIPLPAIAATTVVKAFLSRWVAIFGAPSTITTGCVAQFESNLFQTFYSFLGCTRIRTTAYHPAANGMVERFHRQLKASLRAAADPENWTDHLPLVLLGIRFAFKPDLDCSVAELVFGATVRLPGVMISPTPRGAVENPINLPHRLRQFVRTLSLIPARSSASPSYLEKDLATCPHISLR